MPRPRLPKTERREKISISPHPSVLAWIDSNSGVGKRFKDRTHAFEFAVAKLMEE